MRIPDLESLIEDSEKTSPNYVDNTERQNLIDEAAWMNWAEKQLADAQREMAKLPYGPVVKDRPVDLIPVSNSMAGVTWKTETSGSSKGNWVNTIPVTQSAPMVQSTMQAPVVMIGSGEIHYS